MNRNSEGIPEQADRIMKLMRRMKRIRFWELCGEDVGTGDGMLLKFLSESLKKEEQSTGGVPLSEVIEELHMHPAGLSRLMRSMEGEGLITRDIDPKNRRNIVVQITDKGREKEAHCDAVISRYWDTVFEQIPEEEWDTMLRIWSDVIDSMEKVFREQAAVQKTLKKEKNSR